MLKNLWVSKKRQFVSFPGDRNRGTVSRLFPYSNYKLEMVVTNGRGDGPRSEMKEFPTPEGGTFPQGIFSRWERFRRSSSGELSHGRGEVLAERHPGAAAGGDIVEATPEVGSWPHQHSQNSQNSGALDTSAEKILG